MEIASFMQEGEDRFVPRTLSSISIGSNTSAKGQTHPHLGASKHVGDTRVKLMCSHGGKILPRPSDLRLRYVGGETRMVSVPRHIHYTALLKKLEEIYGDGIAVKYQLPDEDLDALVSVSSEEDVENMMEECDRLEGSSARLRVFVFSSADSYALDLNALADPKVSEQRYVNAVNMVQVEVGLRKASDYGVATAFGHGFRDLESGGESAASSASSLHDLYNRDLTHRWSISSQPHPQIFDASSFGDGEDLAKRLELPHTEDDRKIRGALGNKATAPGMSLVPPTRQFDDLLLSPGSMLQRQLQADQDYGSTHPPPPPRPLLGPDQGSPPPPPLLLEQGHIRTNSTDPFIIPNVDSPLASEHTGFGILDTQPSQPGGMHQLLDISSNLAVPVDPVQAALSTRQSDTTEKADPSLKQMKASESSLDMATGFSTLDDARATHDHGSRKAHEPSAVASQPFSHQAHTAVFQAFPSDVSPSRRNEMDEFLQQVMSPSQVLSESPDLSFQLARHKDGVGEEIVGQHSLKGQLESSLGITYQAAKIQDYEGIGVAELSLAAGHMGELLAEDKNASFPLHKSSIPATELSLRGAYALAVDAKKNPVIEDNENWATPDAVPSPSPVAAVHVSEHELPPLALLPFGQEKGPPEMELDHTSEKEDGKIDDDEVERFQSAADMSLGPAAAAEVEAIAHGLQIIRHYDLEELRELGSGTFGTVFHGKWRGTDVAIKRIKSSCFMGRPSERERLIADFWREACILGQLHHPNVVAFYGVVPDGPGGTLATVTEYMVNGSLKQALQKNDRVLDRRKRLLIAMDAAFGMEYLHGRNVIHFDLKCDNLLVNLRDIHRPICKVGDLGLSKVKQQTMVSGGVRGTLPWMAPELLNGSSSLVSEKVDIFSFGIVLWELLTGEEPYASMHYGAIIGGIVSNTLRPPVPRWCDPAWKSLMEACWSADPAQRPTFSDIARGLRAMEATVKANK